MVSSQGGPAHRAPREPRVRDGRAGLRAHPVRHRRRDQHRADAEGEGRHRAERDRPGARCSASSEPKVAILSAVEMVNPDIASTHRRRRAVQDGRSRPDPRRRSSTGRSRSTTRSARSPRAPSASIAGGRPCRHPAGAEHRVGQHAGQAAAVLRRRRQCGHRARRARARHPDEPRRQRADAHRLGCGREARGARATSRPRPRRSESGSDGGSAERGSSS